MNIVSKIPYGMHGDTNKQASDANYDPVQMDMSEVQWNWMFAHVCNNKYKMLQQSLGRCGIFMGAVHTYDDFMLYLIYKKEWFIFGFWRSCQNHVNKYNFTIALLLHLYFLLNIQAEFKKLFIFEVKIVS